MGDIFEKLKNIDISGYASNFTESDFMMKVKKFGKSAGIGLMYPILLLYNIATGDNVPLADKAKIIGALGYFILPIDLIPDAIIGIGFTDDIAVATMVLKSVYHNVTAEIHDKVVDQLEEMFGEIDRDKLDKFDDLIKGENKH